MEKQNYCHNVACIASRGKMYHIHATIRTHESRSLTYLFFRFPCYFQFFWATLQLIYDKWHRLKTTLQALPPNLCCVAYLFAMADRCVHQRVARSATRLTVLIVYSGHRLCAPPTQPSGPRVVTALRKRCRPVFFVGSLA